MPNPQRAMRGRRTQLIRPPRKATRRRRLDADKVEQRLPALGQRVERHLPLAPIVDQTAAKHADGARPGSRALENPSEIADAELATVTKRECKRQPSRVRKSREWFGEPLRRPLVEARRAQSFRARQIETKQIAAVVPYRPILTNVDT
jgi:hypothetical protein